MKNNKGFTLVEMLVSFTLSMILVIILFQLIINLKELYMSSGIKTDMINKQYLMTNKIYEDLTERKLVSASKCESEKTNCINLMYANGEIKQFNVDKTENTITYDNYTIKITTAEIGIPIIELSTITENKKILTIKVPVNSKNFKNEEFGINIVYPLNSNEITDNYN